MASLKTCSCGATFRGEHWKTACDTCFKDQRGTTTPFAESHHPALVYERNHPEQPVKPCTPEHAEKAIREAKEMTRFEYLAEAKPEPPSQITCEHTFRNGLCGCGMFEVQYNDSIKFMINRSSEASSL